MDIIEDKVKERFLAKVRKSANVLDCWEWTGGRSLQGYGRFRFLGQVQYAHRVAYMIFVGSIPIGLELDHICKVRHCVNPDHLEAVTHRTNILRGNNPMARNARKIHCPFGHLLVPTLNDPARRRCLVCRPVGYKYSSKQYRGTPNKQCCKCGEILDRAMFYIDRSKSDMLTSTCKRCEKQRVRTRRKAA